ncbi:MAG: hypothetical protein GXX08_05295 [Firmicutes bacterium]|nr:hypothetical protein [Bacillota bacterium]
MKRVLAIALAMVLCLSAVAMAQAAEFGRDVKITPVGGNDGLVTLYISDVVYLSFVKASGSGQGFKRAEIDSGLAIFPNIHRLKVSSTVNYLIAANVMNDGDYKVWYEDDVLTSMSQLGSNVAVGSPSGNPDDNNRYISMNLIQAQAVGLVDANQQDFVANGWQHVDSAGSAYPGVGREGSYQTLCWGGPTSGVGTGDRIQIDIALNLAKAAQEGVVIPSGTYTFYLDYVVVETDEVPEVPAV